MGNDNSVNAKPQVGGNTGELQGRNVCLVAKEENHHAYPLRLQVEEGRGELGSDRLSCCDDAERLVMSMLEYYRPIEGGKKLIGPRLPCQLRQLGPPHSHQ